MDKMNMPPSLDIILVRMNYVFTLSVFFPVIKHDLLRERGHVEHAPRYLARERETLDRRRARQPVAAQRLGNRSPAIDELAIRNSAQVLGHTRRDGTVPQRPCRSQTNTRQRRPARQPCGP